MSNPIHDLSFRQEFMGNETSKSPKSVIVVLIGRGYLAINLEIHLSKFGWKVFRFESEESLSAKQFKSKIFNEKICIIHAAGPSGVEQLENLQDKKIHLYSALTRIEKQVSFCELVNANFNYIFISSSSVYGDTSDYGIAGACETSTINPISFYAESKVVQENYIKSILNGGIFAQAKVLRVSSVFGPKLKSRVIWKIKSEMPSGNLTLSGDGNQKRDFIEISDFCRAVEVLLITSDEVIDRKFEIYNIGSGNVLSLRQILNTALQTLEDNIYSVDYNFFSGIERHFDPKINHIDVRKIKAQNFEASRSDLQHFEAYFRSR